MKKRLKKSRKGSCLEQCVSVYIDSLKLSTFYFCYNCYEFKYTRKESQVRDRENRVIIDTVMDYDKNGWNVTVRKRQFDKKLLLVKENRYENGKLQSTNSYTYNKRGDKIKIFIVTRRESKTTHLTFNRKYEYDEHGNWIRQEFYQNGEDFKMIILRKIEYY